MDLTACTEPQYLYKGALYLYLFTCVLECLCHLMFIQDRQLCTYRRYTEARSGNYWCSVKTIIITYSECVCVSIASVIQHAMRLRSTMLSSVACPAVPYFLTISHKRHDFPEEKLLNIKCVLRFSSTIFT